MQIVSLSGGLGNQLFQIAAALVAFPKGDIFVEHKIGFASQNSSGQPEVFSLPISTRFKLLNNKSPKRFVMRAIHQVMRYEATQKNVPRILVVSINYLAEAALRLHYGMQISIISKNLIQHSKSCTNRILIGYFHTTKYINQIDNLKEIVDLASISTSVELEPFINHKEPRPIMMHIRLGDYEKESDFGILPAEYYSRALRIIEKRESSEKLYVFSNDIEKAKISISIPDRFNTDWIHQDSLTTSQTLEAMIYCGDKVIANSTFSWWAAMLSVRHQEMTIYPKPWFRNAYANPDLFPGDWIGVKSWKESDNLEDVLDDK